MTDDAFTLPHLLVCASFGAIAVSMWRDSRGGERRELRCGPVVLIFGPGTNWAFAGLVLALLAGAAHG